MLSCQKHEFSLPPGLHYLNCAYMSPLPQRVEAAGIAGVRRKRVPSAITPADFFAGADLVRALFARLVNVADAGRIAIVPAASYGLGRRPGTCPSDGAGTWWSRGSNSPATCTCGVAPVGGAAARCG
jgi:hypothetical protein